MECSRGSVCYHLDKLQRAEKIQRIYTGRVPRYYLAAAKTENPLEQSLRYLLSLKKSGRVLHTLSEHPAATRKELAELLSISPQTVHWYLRTFTEKELLTTAKDGHELRYSLTNEAAEIYERLTNNSFPDEAAP